MSDLAIKRFISFENLESLKTLSGQPNFNEVLNSVLDEGRKSIVTLKQN